MKLTIAVPAYNEQEVLVKSVQTLHAFCLRELSGYDWRLVIADNASTDQTAVLGQAVARSLERVSYVLVADRGKGAAVLGGWAAHPAEVYAFTDADLATDPEALPLALAQITAGGELVIGSRFHAGSAVQRTRIRKTFSYGYRWLARLLLATKLRDLPCGFKVIRHQTLQAVLPQVRDREWFFDSELTLRAEASGRRVVEVPVKWHEPRSRHAPSRVAVINVSRAYAGKLWQLRRELKHTHRV